ncbi:hypothetical protein NPIL_332901 [Nephila pilipes]|uniref:Uncharacterized protein n=1 Tax=Nephila pilipes TaxID=299642 RepID=A0A8X6PGR9_NEPPI|nr:hypothetical protein NPIL_332901 [Nephila pilipes]
MKRFAELRKFIRDQEVKESADTSDEFIWIPGNPKNKTPDGLKGVNRVPAAPEWTVGKGKGAKIVWYAGLKGSGCPEVNGSGCFGCLPGIFKTQTAA